MFAGHVESHLRARQIVIITVIDERVELDLVLTGADGDLCVGSIYDVGGLGVASASRAFRNVRNQLGPDLAQVVIVPVGMIWGIKTSILSIALTRYRRPY